MEFRLELGLILAMSKDTNGVHFFVPKIRVDSHRWLLYVDVSLIVIPQHMLVATP